MSLKRKFTFETQEAFWDAVINDSWGYGRGRKQQFKPFVVVEVAGDRMIFNPKRGWTPMKNGRAVDARKGGL